jgi:2-dehydro-3-deoxy-D-pentonate aldolase
MYIVKISSEEQERSMVHVKGIIPPMPTFFTGDGQIDREAGRKHIDRLIQAGVHGLFFMGTGGEFSGMRFEQRVQMIRWAVEDVNNRLPVWIGTGSNSTEEVIRLNREAERQGADGVVIINPYFFKLYDHQLWEHYSAAADSTRLPVMLYNFPALTGQELTTDFVCRLALAHDNVIAIKHTVNHIAPIRELIHKIKPLRPHFAILSGFDEYMLDTLVLGGDGCIPASANFAPDLLVSFYNAIVNQDFPAVSAMHRQISRFPYMFAVDNPFVSVVKEAIRLTGNDVPNHVLPPALPLPPGKISQLKLILEQSGLMASQ